MKIGKFSTADLANLVASHELKSLPATVRAIQYRADKEKWEYEEVPTQGGKNGVKKVYTLPDYVVAELEAKGLLPLLHAAAPVSPVRVAKPFRSYLKKGAVAVSGVGVPAYMQPMVANYDAWAAEQSVSDIVPVRYHVNVFGSAGNGYALDEPLETQAMWFRASFFAYLGVQPERCFCTRVKGDSMHPTLIDRGTVLWQMTDGYVSEGIYLFRQVDELRIKRLQRVNSHTLRIISDNSDLYPLEILDLRDMQDHEFEIYGRYLWDCSIKP